MVINYDLMVACGRSSGAHKKAGRRVGELTMVFCSFTLFGVLPGLVGHALQYLLFLMRGEARGYQMT